jgi:site-specific recombinase XerD
LVTTTPGTEIILNPPTEPFRSVGLLQKIWQYLRQDPHEPEDPLFLNKRGEALTRSGLRQLLEQLGEEAGIDATRCSPHTMRHTFAVEFLRAGGNVFTLQQIVGHTTLSMTNRYVALALADIEAQHRQFSPADRLKKGRK